MWYKKWTKQKQNVWCVSWSGVVYSVHTLHTLMDVIVMCWWYANETVSIRPLQFSLIYCEANVKENIECSIFAMGNDHMENLAYVPHKHT